MGSMVLVFEINGNPVPWKAHAGYGRRSFNPRFKEREYVQWKLKEMYHGPLIEAPVRCDLFFYMPIPKSFSKKDYQKLHEKKKHHSKRPDRTNMAKFIEDCLIGIVLADDSQIVGGAVDKQYGAHPKTVIMIHPLEE